MRTLAPVLTAITPRNGDSGAGRLAPAVLAALLEAAAAGILLAVAPQTGGAAVATAVALHLAAAAVVAAWPVPLNGLRWLCAVSVLAVPCVGAAIAAAVLATRGRDLARIGRELDAPARCGHARAAARRFRERLSACDALLDGDEEQRRATLSTLARRADAEGMAVLRWAAAGRDPDLALLAALALDEIGERSELRPRRAAVREVSHAAG